MAVLPTGIGPVTGGYQIERSLRFNSADSAYLNRTFSAPTAGTKWTFSFWMKRSSLGRMNVFGYNGATNEGSIDFDSGNTLYINPRVGTVGGAGTNYFLQTTQVFRDTSAWYHIIYALDTTQATASNRVKLYVNGNQVTTFSTTNYPPQNSTPIMGSAVSHAIGRIGESGYEFYFGGYFSEMYWVDGQALTPSSFGQINASTGVWEPIAYTGTYGTNGFYLKFADNSGTTSTTLGKDSSGNGNNWTPNNFSVTAGAGNDSLVDSPTSYGTDTGVGGSVRGNYCTWNSTWANPTLTNGNLDYTTTSGSTSAIGTLGVSSGKWYFEVLTTTSACAIGVAPPDLFNKEIGETSTSYSYTYSGTKYTNGSTSAYGNSYTANDIIGVALDLDNGKIWFSKNGTFQASGDPAAGTNAAFTGLSGTLTAAVSRMTPTQQSGSLNAGQRAFAYTAPSGFKALCTTNLPTPTIGATSTTQANDYFNVVTYTGNGTSSSRSVTGFGFQPDFVWNKSRSTAASQNHMLYDAVRGTGKRLITNATNAEDSNSIYGYLSSFDSDGYTSSPGSTNNENLNETSSTYVTWAWNAGGSNATNTSGTITSTVRANTTSGFSIVTYTGNGTAGATFGHGLGVAPSVIMFKRRNGATDWQVYHISVGNANTLYLNLTNASESAPGMLNSTTPTSTLITLGSGSNVNTNTATMLAYCFAPVAGYSAFGSYTGNGSADGPFVFTGFRPAFVMVKRTDAVGDWFIWDNKRPAYNVINTLISPNKPDAEITYTSLDFLSNGFKLRNTGSDINASGGTIIYMAFAENPFKYSLAR